MCLFGSAYSCIPLGHPQGGRGGGGGGGEVYRIPRNRSCGILYVIDSPRALEVQSLWSAVKNRSEKDSTYQFSVYRMCLLFALVVYRTHVLSLWLAERN